MATYRMTRRNLLSGLAGGLLASQCDWVGGSLEWNHVWGDEPAKPSYRNIVRKKMMGAPVEAIALDYSVILVKPGSETPVDPNEYKFQIGDKIVVRINPKDNMYIYIFNEGPKGDRVCLLPTEQEKAPFAEKDKPIELPGDGFFEFDVPAGDEKLIVVATTEPTKDLASLANVVFRKDADKLNAAEKELQNTLKGTVEKSLQSMNKKYIDGAKSRGLPGMTKESEFDKFMSEVAKKKHGVIEDPPSKTAGETSTFVMAVASKEAGKPELLVNIPLRSIAKKS